MGIPYSFSESKMDDGKNFCLPKLTHLFKTCRLFIGTAKPAEVLLVSVQLSFLTGNQSVLFCDEPLLLRNLLRLLKDGLLTQLIFFPLPVDEDLLIDDAS